MKVASINMSMTVQINNVFRIIDIYQHEDGKFKGKFGWYVRDDFEMNNKGMVSLSKVMASIEKWVAGQEK